MKTIFKPICILLLIITSQLTGKNNPPAAALMKGQTITFTENKGQVSDQNYLPRPDVLFGGTSKGMAFHLKTYGISYQLHACSPESKKLMGSSKKKGHLRPSFQMGAVSIYRIDITWLNMNEKVSIRTDETLPGYSNYYLASCPNGISEVKSYKGVTYGNIYNNVDLHYYEKAGGLKYDFIVSPGGNYKDITLKVDGATKISVQKDGSLLLKTPLGSIEEGMPLVFQNGKSLPAKWILKNNELSFEISNVDPSQTLIIDPTTRLWGTYYGGSSDDLAEFCVTDASGNVFITGGSASAGGTIIATSGSYQNSFGGGNVDAFVAKFNTNGGRLWATYYGGSGDEYGGGCAVNTSGEVFIAGTTDGLSTTVLSTLGSHQVAFGGGVADAFLAKFSAAGTRVWGTYYGGSGDDESYSCATDLSGNVYLCGYTDGGTGTVIATAGSHQSTFGGVTDAFLVKFNGSGVRQWATYYGGTADDWGNACATNAGGDVFMGGFTDSNFGTVIATLGSHQSTFGGVDEGFVVKFNSSGVRQWGTYYGGSNYDEIYSLAVNTAGDVYVSGSTDSNSGISTSGSHQSNYNGGTGDGFVAKLSGAGVRQWGTYYGGNGYEDNYSCALDLNGNLYIAGNSDTNGGTDIATAGNYQSTFSGGANADAYLAKFDPSGVRQWGTYVGGSGSEFGYCAADLNGDVYLAGYTETSTGTIIANSSAFQPNYGGGSSDGFLIKFSSCSAPSAPVNTTPAGNSALCGSVSTTLTVSGSGTITWYSAATGGSVAGTGTALVTPALNPGSYTYYAEAMDCATSASRTAVSLTVFTLPTVTASSNKTTICRGETATLSAGGALTYSWSGTGSGASIAVTPSTPTTYTVIGTDAKACANSATVSITVNACTGIGGFEPSVSDYKVYPNPSKGKFFVNSPSKSEVSIANVLGEIIYKGTLEPGVNELSLGQAPGIYVVQITSGNNSSSYRLMKE
ncbi:MAG: SBBP repeat-containing protein [bacterium]|nr:SBBP repeat-containing protein [bacterium]